MPTKTQKFSSINRYFIQEPAKASFSRRIESIDTVPEAFKVFFKSILADGQKFPYTILTPSQHGYRYRSTEKLVCIVDSDIYILERSGNTFDEWCYPVAGITYVEARDVLLDSSIKITGVTKKGKYISSIIQFNSVTDYLFAPILEKIRGFATGSNLNVPRTEQEKFDNWQRTSFKFMNYAKHCLLGREHVIHTVLQPEIRTIGIRILGRSFYKVLSPAHAGILTDREIIMIREEVRHVGEDRYGGIWDYIPLSKVTGLSINDIGTNMFSLSIHLTDEVQLDFLYQASARDEVDKLLSRFKETAK